MAHVAPAMTVLPLVATRAGDSPSRATESLSQRPARPARTPRWWQTMEHALDAATGGRDNPLRNLGALGFFFFWIIAATGIYLYALFDTSVAGAWQSVEWLTREQWFLGGVLRSLHRYASGAFAVVMALHLLKETVSRRFGAFRTFSWLTGVPLIWLAFAAGIGGYWLVWDQLAQFSAIATMEWLDALGMFGEPLARNFVSPDSVNDRLFSLFVFLHIGIPLALLLGMWIHIQRVSHPAVTPPRRLALWSFAALLAASLVQPAVSLPPADLSRVPAEIGIDWFYMFIHPLMYRISAPAVWWLAGGATLMLAALPALVRTQREPAATVDPRNCNGCGQCVADCPFVAISLVPHSSSQRYKLQAAVDPARCASCGICVGACPSSTPFRSAAVLASGIEMPQLAMDMLRTRLRAALAARARYVVFGCDCGAQLGAPAAKDVVVFRLPCIGMLPPAFIDYALRRGANGVLVSACPEGDCAYRLGTRWTAQRIRQEREPRLRRSVPRERVRIIEAGRNTPQLVLTELNALRGQLEAASGLQGDHA
jgi:quinol-cytochrome oxidoreductase complex cytochrome b subunit/coenzyme F420-reducing hydrogenase delta subunit